LVTDPACQTVRLSSAVAPGDGGRLTSIETGTTVTPKAIQDLVYQWRSNSTLYRRIDQRNTAGTGDDYTDPFAYDALERLTSQTTTIGASRTLEFGYDLFGNLTSKTSTVGGDLNVTGYQYTTTGKPHRLLVHHLFCNFERRAC
jgi:hypothetical protein